MDRQHEIECTECRGLTKDWINEDRQYFVNENRKMIREEFQTRAEIIEDIKVLKKDVYWSKVLIGINTLAIVFIIFEILT